MWKITIQWLLGKCEFYENLCNERHTLLTGVNEFSPYFPYFLPNLHKIHYRDIHKTLLKAYQLRESHHQESLTLPRSVIQLQSILHTFTVWFGWNLYKRLNTILLCVDGFHQSQHRQRHIFLMGINEIMFMCVPWNYMNLEDTMSLEMLGSKYQVP